MRARYAITFEFPMKQPITVRGEVEANTPSKFMRLAFNDARARLKKQTINWSSFVVVIDRYEAQLETKGQKILSSQNVDDQWPLGHLP